MKFNPKGTEATVFNELVAILFQRIYDFRRTLPCINQSQSSSCKILLKNIRFALLHSMHQYLYADDDKRRKAY